MRVDTLQFIHNSTDILHTFANLNAHGFFNTHTQCMAVLVCTQIVKTVCQGQCLRVGKAFIHFLNAPVNITAVRINLTNDFTFQRNTETHYTMSSRVLRTDVNYILFFTEQLHLFVFDGSVGGQFYFLSRIKRLFIGHTQWVILFRIIIFAHWITYPIVTQIKSAHVRMTYEGDTIKIKNFTFIEVGYLPNVADRWNFR